MLANTFDEIDDYYTIPSVAFQDGDWMICLWIRLDDNSGSTYQYTLSRGTLAATNSFQLFMVESSEGSANVNTWRVNLQDGDGTSTGSWSSASAPGADSKWRLIVLQRNTALSRFELWFCEEGQVATLEATYTDAAFNAISAGTLYVACRSDTDANRFYGGSLAWLAKGDFIWTQTEIEAMGNGLPPYTTAKKSSKTLDFCVKFHESAATLADITGNGYTATRNGAPVVAVDEPLVMSPVKERRHYGQI